MLLKDAVIVNIVAELHTYPSLFLDTLALFHVDHFSVFHGVYLFSLLVALL